jgi:hypothetical protein
VSETRDIGTKLDCGKAFEKRFNARIYVVALNTYDFFHSSSNRCNSSIFMDLQYGLDE